MAVGFSISLTLLLSLWTSTTSHQIPEGVLQMECRDRYFMIAVNLSFTGEKPRFEVVDEGGANLITESYGAQYGYTVSILPARGLVELEPPILATTPSAKYTGDLLFMFSFNLIVSRDGEDVKHPLNKTCSPALAWAPREVTCEVNYMEVSVVNNEACPTGTKEDDWDASANMVYRYATSEWQVAMRKPGQEMVPMNISEALRRGYEFHLTEGRLAFRTPYGQPDSFTAQVNGVPVQVVHAILFSREGWVIITVDLLASCSMHEGSHESGYLQWKGREFPDPSKVQEVKVSFGLNGKLEQRHLSGVGNMADSAAEKRGYVVEKHNSIFQISIPYKAEGGQRKSLVSNGLHEFYTFNLYVEQILLEGDRVHARLRIFRTLVTPLLPRPLFSENRTLLEDRLFSAHLGNIPEDVVLVAVGLNGQEFPLQANTGTSFAITEVVHPNNTCGYTLEVPFDHPVVIQQFSRHDGAMRYTLKIQFTLHVVPENKPVYHQTSVTVLMDASPPAINASCSDSGIRFTLAHRPFNYLWKITIDSDPLTSELAAQHGYIMSNDSQRLQLDVPLFTTGYKYNNVTLKGFSSTFEVELHYPETAEVHSRVNKTCSFSLSQYISCSSSGMMTVVADLSPMVKSGVDPARTSLLDKNCRPTESDSTRVLYSFSLNSCGNTVKVSKDFVTYQNKIFLHSDFHNVENPLDLRDDLSVVIQCTYPLESLHRFFWTYMFESETAGVGHILYAKQPSRELQTSTTQPTTTRRKWSSFLQPSYRLPYFNIPTYPRGFLRKGVKGA